MALFSAKSPIPLDVYVGPGKGRVDLSKHQGGPEGFKKAVEDFTSALSPYDRRSLELEEKVVLVGEPSVGKTCLLQRYINESYTKDYQATIGLDYHKQHYTCAGYDFTLCILDTAGQERFRAISNHYYRGFLQWVTRVKKDNPHTEDLCVFLAGCKSDMFHVVSDTQAEQLAAELKAEYFEVSAKSGFNVRTLFDRVAFVLFERALLRQTAEWKQQTKKPETVKLTSEENVNEGLLGDPGAGKGMDNWKKVEKASGRSRCCGAS